MSAVIETKYLGPTDYRGSRIKARVAIGRPSDGHRETITIQYDYELNATDYHRKVAEILGSKVFTYAYKLVGGEIENGYVWVLAFDNGNFSRNEE